jgi:hypothetical protein
LVNLYQGLQFVTQLRGVYLAVNVWDLESFCDASRRSYQWVSEAFVGIREAMTLENVLKEAMGTL